MEVDFQFHPFILFIGLVLIAVLMYHIWMPWIKQVKHLKETSMTSFIEFPKWRLIATFWIIIGCWSTSYITFTGPLKDRSRDKEIEANTIQDYRAIPEADAVEITNPPTFSERMREQAEAQEERNLNYVETIVEQD